MLNTSKTITPVNETSQQREAIASMKRGGRSHQRHNTRDMKFLVSFWAGNDRQQPTTIRQAV